ncbi:MAG TPA: hypothetical protein VK140_14040 [Ktedonobacteraceae bacterium]|nr:hypothetical protein [Ktedonobacteraceae bacterium]
MMTAGGRDQSGPYPTRDEYDIAMARWRESIWDAEILRFAQDDNRQWNTGWANAQQPSQQAPSPSQFWNTGTLAAPGSVQAPPYAGPPIPFPPTLNEDDDPLPLSSPGSNASGGKRRVLLIATICFLVLIILAAAITLALIFTGDIHIADIAPLMGQAWLRWLARASHLSHAKLMCIVQGGCYAITNP